MPFGLEGRLVEVEADILQGLPAFTIVGLGDTAVQEAKERIRSAIKNSGFAYPQTKKIINLAPAHLKKHGPQFDLPMAVSLLVSSGQLGAGSLASTLLVGELALDGSVRAVVGVMTMALFARNNGWSRIIVPEENFAEASLVKGLEIVPVGHLSDITGYKNQNGLPKPKEGQKSVPGQTFGIGDNQSRPSTSGTESATDPAPDFADIFGQAHAKRALTIAAAGNHHILI
jgi:magnesium chelatase family protein